MAGISRLFFLALLLVALLPDAQASEKLPSIFTTAFFIGAHYSDYQNYHNVPYIHGGLDLCAPAGTDVSTPVSGIPAVSDYKITATLSPHRFAYSRRPFRSGETSSTRYLEVAITTPDKTVWMFRHIDTTSIPKAIFNAAEKKITVPAGTVIGRIGLWPYRVLPEKKSYDHVHLEIVASDGAFLDPARFIDCGKDYYPPLIHSVFAARHTTSEALLLDANNQTISGKTDLIISVDDRMNQSAYRHSVYRASWSLEALETDGSTSEVVSLHEALHFSTLPFKGDRTQLSTVIYRDYLATGRGRIQANGNHGPRIFLLNLTSGKPPAKYSASNCLDTTELKNGKYRLRIVVADRAGNTREKTVEFRIKN
jgi:hypothetical protein